MKVAQFVMIDKSVCSCLVFGNWFHLAAASSLFGGRGLGVGLSIGSPSGSPSFGTLISEMNSL